MSEELNEDGLLVNTPDAIFTHSGVFIRPLDPNPDAIRIEDIAHALSQQCRWTGHTSTFYSVAEHCLGVAALVEPELRLTALLHDASEAYLADLARPIKKAPGLGEVYLEVEARLEMAICMRFNTYADALKYSEIKYADEEMLWAEAKLLLPRLGSMLPEPSELALDLVRCLEPREAEDLFLRAFYRYGGKA
jgi:uncharacterized protein